jgi:glycosyltransferase involved in cell wall biosynthesis
MKVLAAVVVPPHLSVSGAARAAERLSAELAHLDGVEVDVATMAGPPSEPAPPPTGPRAPGRVPVRVTNPLGWTSRFLPNRFRTFFYRSTIPTLVRTGGYDLLHLHNPTPGLEMARVARAARRAGIPYVVSTHGFVEVAEGPTGGRLEPLLRAAWWVLAQRPVRWVVGHARLVLVLSPSDRGVLDRLGGVGVPTALVPNGVDLPGAGDPEALAGLALPPAADGELRAFFLANHTPNKGLPVLLEAFDRLRTPYTLVVGGERRDFVDYDRYARDDAGRRVRFTGPLTDAQVDALFEWADVFVFPTLADTLPLVVLEAMAHGTPVVASDVGGISFELDGGCGALVPPGDPEALAGTLDELADDRARLEAMGRAARQRAATRFSWTAAAEAARDAYAWALSRDDHDRAGTGVSTSSVA